MSLPVNYIQNSIKKTNYFHIEVCIPVPAIKLSI